MPSAVCRTAGESLGNAYSSLGGLFGGMSDDGMDNFSCRKYRGRMEVYCRFGRYGFVESFVPFLFVSDAQ